MATTKRTSATATRSKVRKKSSTVGLAQKLSLFNGRGLVVLLAVLVVGITVVAFSSAATATPEIKSGVTGKCLDDALNSTVNANKVDSYVCNGSGGQQWVKKTDGTIRVYNKCLDVYQRSVANGAKIDLYTCNGGKNQQWRYNATTHTLIGVQSGKCLNIPNSQNGTQVQLWTCNGGLQQKWYFSSFQPVSTPVPTVSKTPTPAPTPAPVTAAGAQPVGITGNWALNFDDEFNGSSLDTSKWATGWFGSGVTQAVNTSEPVCMSPSNVVVTGGELDLNLVKQASTCGGKSQPYTSGMITSNGKYQFTHGVAEARIWVPGTGATIYNWPSWWTDGQNWPADGEIDILEGLGGDACAHYHVSAYPNGEGTCATGTFTGGWHTYAANWQSGSLKFYYDGKLIWTDTNSIANSPQYLILDMAMSGSYIAPVSERVDYVRVWQ